MKIKYILLNLFLFHCTLITYSQSLSNEEKNLYDLIMGYRNEKGLPIIPISTSLTHVAQLHVRDLVNNRPDQGVCNMHSWSSNGPWSSCCYTSDHARAQCMWSKPKELSNYKGDGYEIAFGSFGIDATPESALNTWKSSSGHNAVIINQGIWNDRWNAIGIGLYKGFAVVWFGKEYDNQNDLNNSENQSKINESTNSIPTYNNEIVNNYANNLSGETKRHKLISIKVGYAANILTKDINNIGSSFKNQLSYHINSMVGFNLGKHKKNSCFAFFSSYGNYNKKNTTLLNNDLFHTNNNFLEIECGFLIKEFFRLSGGLGYSKTNSIAINSYDYNTITAGFSFGPKWLKFDLSNTLIIQKNLKDFLYRPSLGLSFVLNIVNKK